jgi:hypothetical protein
MKYALLAYDLESSLDELASEDKAALHAAHSTLPENETTHGSGTVITHYRFRPPRLTSARRRRTTCSRPPTTTHSVLGPPAKNRTVGGRTN